MGKSFIEDESVSSKLIKTEKSGEQTVTSATINGDGSSGTKVYTFTLNKNALITEILLEITQVDGSDDNTISVSINNTDDLVSVVSTPLSDKAIHTATQMHVYRLADGDTTIHRTSTTNKYVVIYVKDTGNNGDAFQSLKFKCFLSYVEE